MTKRQDATTRMLWASTRNQLACPEHAPPIASAEWWAGGWRIFGPDEQRGYEGARGEAPYCWACRAIEQATSSVSTAHTDQRSGIVTTLARRLGVDDLEVLGDDDADFQDIHIGLLREALEDAFDAGRASALSGVGGIR